MNNNMKNNLQRVSSTVRFHDIVVDIAVDIVIIHTILNRGGPTLFGKEVKITVKSYGKLNEGLTC